MPETVTSVQQELAGWIARYAGAVNRVVQAYAERRTRESDITFLALQATKEYGAMAYHSGVALRKARALEPLESIKKSNHDCFEEAEHFLGYMEILNWYLDGKPCEVPEMWGYGDIANTFGPGPGMKQSLWPEHYGYFALGEKLAREARSQWIRQAILTNREGAAVGFHYVMSKLRAADEYLRRITHHEHTVAEDELHHGSEMIPELARSLPAMDQLEEARAKVTDVHVQEIRQRNEQFLHPLNEAEMQQLEADFRAQRIEPIWFFASLER
jgi:hypothetical protein